MREDRGLGDALHPLDVPGAVHVEAPQPEEDDPQEQSWNDHPWTDSKYHRQDSNDHQANLKKKSFSHVSCNNHV